MGLDVVSIRIEMHQRSKLTLEYLQNYDGRGSNYDGYLFYIQTQFFLSNQMFVVKFIS